jgi:transketolase
LIEVRTIIGYGSPKHAGKSSAHGSPLGTEESAKVKEVYNWPHEPFHVPDEVYQLFEQAKAEGKRLEEEWNQRFESYKKEFPELAKQLEDAIHNRLPAGWDEKLPKFTVADGKIATRDASGKVLNAIAAEIPFFLGGSADLASSNKTALKDEPKFSPPDYKGRNIWFGVREHAMGAALNGMALHGGVKVYGGTFFVFSDYLRPAIRLSALMQVPVIYVLTHDSIAVGEDGPTHQPIEQLPSLRAMPGLIVFRPADANETAAAYRYAVAESKSPVAMVLSRQGLPTLEGTTENVFEKVARGAYVVSDAADNNPQVVLLATGSEVGLAVAAQKQLAEQGIQARVVSMPSWELFEEQPQSYKDSVIPPSVKARVAIEMAHPMGWERYVGDQGSVIGIKGFGASAPGDIVMKGYGFTVDNVISEVKKVLNK